MTFRIEKAEEDSYGEIGAVILSVWEQMEEKSWFVVDNAEDAADILKDHKGMAYIAVEEESGRIAGVFLTVFPGDSDENLGRDIGVALELLPQIAHMESAAVLPEYRGNRLQYRLMQASEKELRQLGFRYLMCTVHPENRFSMENVMGQGYEVMAVKEKYGGYRRAILMKKLGVGGSSNRTDPECQE